MRLSIIVPMLNEAEQLPELFAHLLPYQRAGCEIIFVDGGSADGSAMLCEVAGFICVAHCSRQSKANECRCITG